MMAQLQKANEIVTTCDPFLSPRCPGSLSCQNSPAGVKLTCVAGMIQSTFVGGVCAPAIRQLQSSVFGTTGGTIVVTLNAAAKDTSVPCSTIFDTASVALLGASSWCTVGDRQVTIKMDPAATIIPGQNLTARSDQNVLVDRLQPTVAFSGLVTVQSCLDCMPPNAAIVGPQVVVAACDPTTAAPVTYDAGYSSDPSGRRLISLVWGQQAAQGALTDPALDDLINAVNFGGGNLAAKAQFKIPQQTLAQLSVGSYTLTITVKSFLGQVAMATLTFSKKPSGAVPVVSIIGGQSQVFKIAEGLKVGSNLQATSVCGGKEVRF